MANLSSYDLHLSALSISADSRRAVEDLGFVRDEFANNRHCVASEYHATYRGDALLPNDALWDDVRRLLRHDVTFSGHLEEEQLCQRIIVPGSTVADGSIRLVPFILSDVLPGLHKACDIHLGVQIDAWSEKKLALLDELRMVSFEKPTADGVRRVYTITCESVSDGEVAFAALEHILSAVCDAPARMKLERTSRYLRHPSNAIGLPLVRADSLQAWLGSITFKSEGGLS